MADRASVEYTSGEQAFQEEVSPAQGVVLDDPGTSCEPVQASGLSVFGFGLYTLVTRVGHF